MNNRSEPRNPLDRVFGKIAIGCTLSALTLTLATGAFAEDQPRAPATAARQTARAKGAQSPRSHNNRVQQGYRASQSRTQAASHPRTSWSMPSPGQSRPATQSAPGKSNQRAANQGQAGPNQGQAKVAPAPQCQTLECQSRQRLARQRQRQAQQRQWYPAQRQGQRYPGQTYNGQRYPGQPYNGQPYNGQPYNGQPYNGQTGQGQQRVLPGQGQQRAGYPVPTGQGQYPTGQGYRQNGYGYQNQYPQNQYTQNQYPQNQYTGLNQPAPTDATADSGVPEEEASPPFFDAMLGTQVPLSIGAMLSLELPGRILVQGELGWMPRAYGSVIDGLMQNFPGYKGAIARVVNSTLEDAVVGRASLGWRPIASAGFEVHAGYTMLSLGGQSTGADIADLVGGDFEERFRDQIANTTVTVDTKLHNFHIGVGWRFVLLDDHLVLRASLAYMQTVAADTDVTISDQPQIQELAQQVADAELSPVFVDNVKLPVFGLNAGYRF